MNFIKKGMKFITETFQESGRSMVGKTAEYAAENAAEEAYQKLFSLENDINYFDVILNKNILHWCLPKKFYDDDIEFFKKKKVFDGLISYLPNKNSKDIISIANRIIDLISTKEIISKKISENFSNEITDKIIKIGVFKNMNVNMFRWYLTLKKTISHFDVFNENIIWDELCDENSKTICLDKSTCTIGNINYDLEFGEFSEKVKDFIDYKSLMYGDFCEKEYIFLNNKLIEIKLFKVDVLGNRIYN